MFQAAALAKSSLARDSAVHPARGERPLEARALATWGSAASCWWAWTAGRVRPAMLAAEMRTTALSQGSLECSAPRMAENMPPMECPAMMRELGSARSLAALAGLRR